MAGFLRSSIHFIPLSVRFLTPVAVLLHPLLASFCQCESFPKSPSAKSASWVFLLPASSEMWEESNKMDSVFKVYVSVLRSFALSLRASSWGRLSPSRSASLHLFSVNVSHPLRQAAFAGAGGRAGELSAWGDFAEVGEKVCSNKGVSNLALRCLKSPNERVSTTA